MTNYMVKSGTGCGRICFTNPAPARFPKSKSGTVLIEGHAVQNKFTFVDYAVLLLNN